MKKVIFLLFFVVTINQGATAIASIFDTTCKNPGIPVRYLQAAKRSITDLTIEEWKSFLNEKTPQELNRFLELVSGTKIQHISKDSAIARLQVVEELKDQKISNNLKTACINFITENKSLEFSIWISKGTISINTLKLKKNTFTLKLQKEFKKEKKSTIEFNNISVEQLAHIAQTMYDAGKKEIAAHIATFLSTQKINKKVVVTDEDEHKNLFERTVTMTYTYTILFDAKQLKIEGESDDYTDLSYQDLTTGKTISRDFAGKVGPDVPEFRDFEYIRPEAKEEREV
ncbi:MAG: hypothetical protein WCW33_04055 [Candidatus Babeliales bacterium]|jgi:hypothetical protein